jgi:ribosomal-protein-alanine N-acetyltransferase
MPGALVAAGDRISLRTVESEDIPFIQRAHANPELRYPLGWDIKSQSELRSELDGDRGHDEAFLVCLDQDKAGPGSVGLEATKRVGSVVAGVGPRARAGIGFWIIPEAQGSGYATEAVSALLDYLFRIYPHPAVYASALPVNEASRGLLTSLGFSEEGRARKEAFWDGEYRDTIQYSILRSEWKDHGDS